MGKRIILIVILVAAVVFGYYYYKHHQDEVRLASGEVTCDGCMTPAEHARFLRENAVEAADAQSERRTKVTPAGDPTATGALAGNSTSSTTDTTSPAQTTQSLMTPPKAQDTSIARGDLSAPPPATDTVSPNPTNGMVFSGKGTYQWYRQGNLTWRVDTTSGRSCIIYATMEEWRKRIVLSHGCGRSA